MTVTDLETEFAGFLEGLKNSGWITHAKWTRAESQEELKSRMGKAPGIPGTTRSHKKDAAGIHWGIDIVGPGKTVVGVDLEVMTKRRILNEDSAWFAERLSLDPKTEPRNLIEEWCVRESSLKALSLATGARDLIVADFERRDLQWIQYKGAHEQYKSIQIEYKIQWSGDWVLSVSRILDMAVS